MNQQPSASPSACLESRHQQLNAQLCSMDVDQWKYLVARIGEPTTARVIVEYLDNDATQKARFAGIYLRARDTVQRARVRYAKSYRWGQRCVRALTWIARPGKKATTGHDLNQHQDRLREEAPASALVWPELNWS